MRRPFPIAPMASCFALAGFAIAIVSGLSGGAEAIGVLQGAILAMVICYIVAMVLGKGCATIVREHLERYSEERPLGAPPLETADALPFDTSPPTIEESAPSAPEAEAA